MSRRSFLLWLFPVALLMAQTGSLAHSFAHAVAPGTVKERLAAPDLCEQCVSFAKLAHVAADAMQSPIDAVLALQSTPAGIYDSVGGATAPYRSRGPPILV